jgi:hypothetical protein
MYREGAARFLSVKIAFSSFNILLLYPVHYTGG